MSVNNHAALLAETGHRDEALTYSQEAVDLHRELVDLNRDDHLPNLARALRGSAWVRQLLATELDEAELAVTEAIGMYTELVEVEYGVLTGELSAARRTLAEVLDGLGRTE